jgi:hypothetical protein
VKNRNLSKWALLGLTSGVLASCGTGGSDKEPAANPMEQLGEKVATIGKNQLLSQLNESSRTLFESLDGEGKALVLRVASSKCAGENPCGGLNGCKSSSNDCAGQAKCAGQGGCAADANMAVKLVIKKLAEKRSGLGY